MRSIAALVALLLIASVFADGKGPTAATTKSPTMAPTTKSPTMAPTTKSPTMAPVYACVAGASLQAQPTAAERNTACMEAGRCMADDSATLAKYNAHCDNVEKGTFANHVMCEHCELLAPCLPLTSSNAASRLTWWNMVETGVGDDAQDWIGKCRMETAGTNSFKEMLFISYKEKQADGTALTVVNRHLFQIPSSMNFNTGNTKTITLHGSNKKLYWSKLSGERLFTYQHQLANSYKINTGAKVKFSKLSACREEGGLQDLKCGSKKLILSCKIATTCNHASGWQAYVSGEPRECYNTAGAAAGSSSDNLNWSNAIDCTAAAKRFGGMMT